ncbi:hypothetical protein C8250_037335 [Streptomyces sp. So13.3]|uniref:hypothetical protein n=1 Tax=Streptomyces TaxID=1883 RepID=UPI0011075592|nr:MULTISPECIES: hypothetical protein [Streptomyces]MCZ4097801.1 hypothetical protein [Streptomyces sp. H39-C1]QNA76787.1 hypothetical protein C8250_037335 [Streptomyces sp. So13.3]
MSPPPPPFGFSRAKDDFGFDPALDDVELVAARSALGQGHWSEVRTLLAETGDHWDRRGHRLVVLAEGPATAAWTREWQLAEPDSQDAAMLLACSTVFRAVAGKANPEVAREACLAVARLAPADPSPWLALLILARRTGTDEDQVRAFDQVRGRHRSHHHAHHLMTACLAERQKTDRNDPFHEVYEFAEWAAGEAPEGSPLAGLPLLAHIERYRVLAGTGAEPKDPTGLPHWTSGRGRQSLRTAFDWWLEWHGGDHPRLELDLNLLAFAMVHSGRPVEAAALFNRIGPHATRRPWSYFGRDPKKAFRAARSSALGFGSP